jgi:hypothetical protein
MPTGYTAALHDGEQSFEEYALGVARGFGALITMRDAPADVEIPEVFEPSDYYVKRVADLRSDLDAISNMSDARLAQVQAVEISDAEQRLAVFRIESAARRARYEAMLERARAYEPPTPDHVGLKETMVQQLVRSIDFDCGGSYEPAVPPALPLSEYRAARVAEAKTDLAYAIKSLEEEQERADGRTAWVQALRNSLRSEAS